MSTEHEATKVQESRFRIHSSPRRRGSIWKPTSFEAGWIPACAGMTGVAMGWRSALAVIVVVLLIGVGGCSTTRMRDELPLPYRQAEDAFRLGDYERAVKAYRVFIKNNEDDEDVPRAYYKMALAEYRRGRYSECLAVLNELENRYSRFQWPQVYTLRGDAELQRDN